MSLLDKENAWDAGPQGQEEEKSGKPLEVKPLSQIDLTHELSVVLANAKRLQEETMQGAATPQQKASTLDSLAKIIGQITKTQTDLYNADRIRLIENSMVRVLRKLDPDKIEEFLGMLEGDFTLGENDDATTAPHIR